jgi:predicted transglutaminase-like cysteine proteinase
VIDLYTVNAAVNAATRWACPAVAAACVADYEPRAAGDCKTFAANKLYELVRLGADPRDFVIWIVQQPRAKLRHAVLLHVPSGDVLDTAQNGILRRATLEHEGVKFIEACPDCGAAAIAAARYHQP